MNGSKRHRDRDRERETGRHTGRARCDGVAPCPPAELRSEKSPSPWLTSLSEASRPPDEAGWGGEER